MRYFYYHVAKAHKVSKTRFNIGLVLFIVPFIPNYFLAYAPNLFPDAYLVRSIIHFYFDLILISSLFVLGGDFWDKHRDLFIYTAKARFEEENLGNKTKYLKNDPFSTFFKSSGRKGKKDHFLLIKRFGFA